MKWNGTAASEIARDVYGDIRENIRSDDPNIDAVLGQMFSQKGKVIRPLFMALVGRIMDCPWSRLRTPAMVIESIHVASLIHDDVVDDSHLRRGSATLNARFSGATSVLFGDYIFLKALHAVNDIDHPRAQSILFRAIERMIEGEINEDLSVGIVDEKTYLNIIGNKTAALFAASGELAVALADGDDDTVVLGRELGESVGMAFQIVDDTLDFVGQTEVMGKPRFADISSERFTLPVIHALKDTPADEIAMLFTGNNDTAERIAEMVHLNGGIEYAYEIARGYSSRARDVLREFGSEKALKVFDDFFDMLVSRVY